ncbi:MAG: DUF4224 domain-containing protein [Candidatus Thiodiazotropha endolucinida]
MLVSLDDLKELTDCGHRHTMIRWLVDRGWKFEVGMNGWPKVAIEEFNRHMVGGTKSKRTKKLNIDAIK